MALRADPRRCRRPWSPGASGRGRSETPCRNGARGERSAQDPWSGALPRGAVRGGHPHFGRKSSRPRRGYERSGDYAHRTVQPTRGGTGLTRVLARPPRESAIHELVGDAIVVLDHLRQIRGREAALLDDDATVDDRVVGPDRGAED